MTVLVLEHAVEDMQCPTEFAALIRAPGQRLDVRPNAGAGRQAELGDRLLIVTVPRMVLLFHSGPFPAEVPRALPMLAAQENGGQWREQVSACCQNFAPLH